MLILILTLLCFIKIRNLYFTFIFYIKDMNVKYIHTSNLFFFVMYTPLLKMNRNDLNF